jgi:hypothetical protein
MAKKDQQISQFTERFVKAFGDNAVSLILYGSGAGAEFSEQYSDLNMLCVLRHIGPPDLAASEPLFRWWGEQGNPAPVLMSEAEVAGSTDCFPIEYQDMQTRRRVLHGRDVIQGLVVDRSFYRAQVEYELRSKLLRLRQKAAGVLRDETLLAQLMADSLSTFVILGRHGLLLAGHEGGSTRRETVAKFREHFALDGLPFETLLDVREGKKKSSDLDAAAVFTKYLIGVQQLVDAVDSLHK